jgi:hypothetical protein
MEPDVFDIDKFLGASGLMKSRIVQTNENLRNS